jgi:hypothetical protein
MYGSQPPDRYGELCVLFTVARSGRVHKMLGDGERLGVLPLSIKLRDLRLQHIEIVGL